MHFWLHHTAHCAEKIVSARLRAGSASAERVGQGEVGQGEVGGVTGRVLCTWWLLVGTRWATPRPDCMDRLRKHYSHLAEGWFLARKAAWSLSGCMATNSADYYVLVNEWAWSKSRDCLLRLEVDMGSVLESELGQKWR